MFKQFGKALKNPRGSVFLKKKKMGKTLSECEEFSFSI